MRIVIAVHGTKDYTGISKYSYLLAIALVERGVDVSVIVDSPIGHQRINELYPGLGIKTSVVEPSVTGGLSMAKFSYNLAKYLEKHTDFDILHTSHVTPFFYLMLKNHKPVVFQPFGNELFTLAGRGLNRLYCLMAQPVLRYCGHHADRLISEGEFQHKDMVKWYGVNESDLRVLPVGVGSQPRKTTYTRRATMQFLAVNSLYEYEGMGNLVSAFKVAYEKCKAISLVIVGSGSMETKLHEMAHGLPIKFLKNIPEAELKALYLDSDVFVCTSKETDYQMGVLEAMTIGVPVIITQKVLWMPDDKFLAVTNEENLAEILILVSRMSPEDMTRVVARAQEGMEQFSFSSIADKAIKIYEELLCNE